MNSYKQPKVRDFTAKRNPGLSHAFLATVEVSSLGAELIAYDKSIEFESRSYSVQGDMVALKRLAPCDILVSFQTYVNGEQVAVFRIKETPTNEHL